MSTTRLIFILNSAFASRHGQSIKDFLDDSSLVFSPAPAPQVVATRRLELSMRITAHIVSINLPQIGGQDAQFVAVFGDGAAGGKSSGSKQRDGILPD